MHHYLILKKLYDGDDIMKIHMKTQEEIYMINFILPQIVEELESEFTNKAH